MMKSKEDISRRDAIILLSLLFVSVALIVFGIINERAIKELMIVSPSGGEVQTGVQGGEGNPDQTGQAVEVVRDGKGQPSVLSFFLYAAAVFFGTIILMMVMLTALLLFIQRLRMRSTE